MILDVMDNVYDDFLKDYPNATVVKSIDNISYVASHVVLISRDANGWWFHNKRVRYIVTKNTNDSSHQLIVIRKTPEYTVHTTLYSHPETKYLEILKRILHEGIPRNNERTGTGTLSIFNQLLSIDLLQGYIPIQDLRKTPRKMIYNELKWYLSGSTDVTELHKHNIHVWDGNTSKEFLQQHNLPYEEYDMGPTYGFQFRHAGAKYNGKHTDYTNQGIDQWERLKTSIVQQPESRRHIIQLYNVNQLDDMTLPPCLMMYQFYLTPTCTENTYFMDGIFYSRSSDIFLAGYWNLCQMFLIMHILSHEVFTEYTITLKPRTIHWHIGDTHIYSHQIDQVKELVSHDVQQYYRFKELTDTDVVIDREYNPQTSLTSSMAV
jgi:thymidylate synthase